MFLSDSLLTISGSVAAGCNGVSRVLSGILQDRYGFKKVFGIFMLLQLIDAMVIYHVRHIAGIYPICIAIGFMGQGTNVGCLPALVVQIFGMKSGG